MASAAPPAIFSRARRQAAIRRMTRRQTAPEAVLPMAQGLRQRLGATPLRTPSHATTSVTVSVGVALFDGHPDYQRMVDRAGQALRQAKLGGPNRCMLAQ